MCWRVFAGVAGTSNIGNLAQVRVVNGGAIRAEGSRGEMMICFFPPLRHGARVLFRHRNKWQVSIKCKYMYYRYM